MRCFTLFLVIVCCCFSFQKSHFWGFYAHQHINRLAIFTLPPELMPFYKHHLRYLVEHSVDPDQRRYAVANEAPRHFIDLDNYGDSALVKLPRYWKDAVEKIGEDSLMKHGIVPWHIQAMKYQLTKAFQEKDTWKILKLSAEMGHYIADANVPLHTTSNYNGQKTNQVGIHAFWESRLPELFAKNYDFFVGTAQYVESPTKRIWLNITQANACLDSVLVMEKRLSKTTSEAQRYVIEEKNGQNIKTYARSYSQKYHQLLNNQVERQMRRSIKMIGDFWFTCWVDAGQPDLEALGKESESKEQTESNHKERLSWLQHLFTVRQEGD